MKDNDLDLSIYQETKYPGKRLMAVGIAMFTLTWLSQFVIRWEHAPEEMKIGLFILLIPASICYFVGFWNAVEGKGYPRVLWLASFTGLIGMFIIMYLPNKRKEEQENQSGARNSGNCRSRPTRRGPLNEKCS